MSNETIEKKNRPKHRVLKFFGLVILMGIMVYCILLLIPYIFLIGGAV